AEFPTGTIVLRLGGIRRGALVIPAATLAAHGTRLHNGTIELELDRHVVRTVDGRQWSGPNGARVTVADDRIAIADLRTGTGDSRLTVSATITPSTGDLAAQLAARDVSLALVDPALAGTVAADIDVKRTGGLWSGTATVDAKQ